MATNHKINTPVSLLLKLQSSPTEDDWERFYELYSPLVYGATRRAGLAEADAADVVQDVFAQMLTYLPRFNYRGRGFGNLLWTIARNRCLKALKKRGLAPVQADTLQLKGAAANSDSFASEHEFRAAAVQQAWRLLSVDLKDVEREAYQLNAVDGLSASEVAEQLDISVNQVYLFKSRITKRLRTMLQDLIE